ncbi:MAG: chorismate-binding protein [Bdellovibrio sp.]|nr:chorismate-binding protein [Bdellovibrio sp.]
MNSSLEGILPSETVIFQPHFWDFLESQTQPQFLVGQSSFLLMREEFKNFLDQCAKENFSGSWEKANEASFKEQFDWSQKKFAADELQKTVPIISQKSSNLFNEKNLSAALHKLISEKNFGWSYGFWQNQQGYVGHTPEKIGLWHLSEQKLLTTALAGTLAKSPTAAIEIMNDVKNREEHEIVVEDIVNKMSHIPFLSSLQQSETQAVELKHLVHLKTEFAVKVENLIQAIEVIKVLHPTAALGLFPAKKNQYASLRELQSALKRKNFAAPFAIFSHEFLFCVAAIRNFHFKATQVEIFSGCGVTAKSNYENELTELSNKRESVKKMMGFAN